MGLSELRKIAENATPHKRWVSEGTRVRAVFATGVGIYATGKVIAYTDEPTVVIETDRGDRVRWIARLCTPIRSRSTEEPLIGFRITRDRLQAIPEPTFSERMELRWVLAIIDELEDDTRKGES
ncbi:hypothetical protein [Microbacterium sp.]|uniref:hypothetical protein n=1 Tax=Microbacterium sp. TaxID=51671 RepID=UPI0032428F85